jgi:hypothetical protein
MTVVVLLLSHDDDDDGGGGGGENPPVGPRVHNKAHRPTRSVHYGNEVRRSGSRS